MAIRPVVVHGANQFAVAERVISREFYFPDLYLRSFVYFKHQDHGVAGSDSFVLRRHRRELPAMFAEQFLQHHFRFLDACGIELAFHREPDFFLLESIQNVRFGDGVDAVVANSPDHRPLFHLKNDDFPVGLFPVFHLQFYVFEKLRVPQRLKVAAQGFFVVRIAHPAEDARLQCVSANPAVAFEVDAFDERLVVLLRVSENEVRANFINFFFQCIFVQRGVK